MNFDFSALLLILTVVSGAIWAVDTWLLAPKRRGIPSQVIGESTAATEPLIVEYARSFFPIFLIVLILRSFIVEPFRIPSASMMPTLLIGDFILVNKYDYGIRLPVLNAKILDNKAPKRGDIIVFRYPEDPSIPYIKRVIGVPGDQLEYRDKTLFINDVPMKQEIMGAYYTEGTGSVSWLNENLGTVEHEILINPYVYSESILLKGDKCSFEAISTDSNEQVKITVPEDSYFAMGDNRDNSRDSRCWGFVPEENLIGRAFFIWMNWRFDGIWNVPSWGMKFSRIGTIIR
ncbi:MAG: signal peptidase I [Gammaproteobacteria bacterium RIFCSPLOWO2_02_FULL_52_10]|nr:MAG: signal peptidase I [Gammaproteobacteria bacterium RIFCSPLOWO2_02_FULL_52_10]